VFSTFDIDRMSERVDPEGWELDDYKANPVVLWSHLTDIPAIGMAENVAADKDGLHGEIVFSRREFDPFGWAIGERVKAGIIRGGSVGFQVLKVEIPDKAEQDKGTTLIFRRQALLEFSICNVPANPFALGWSGAALSAPSSAGASLPSGASLSAEASVAALAGGDAGVNHGFMPLLLGDG
jgi:HK97 family phage prohead protease